jgi:bZIP transcription factor
MNERISARVGSVRRQDASMTSARRPIRDSVFRTRDWSVKRTRASNLFLCYTMNDESARSGRTAKRGNPTDAEDSSSPQQNSQTAKKLRRLEKNRLSARECRRRKREAAEQLEKQIDQLENENLQLRLQLRTGTEGAIAVAAEQEKLTAVLQQLLASGAASETEIYNVVEQFKEKFADYGRDRRTAIEYHLQNIERLLLPTQTTSFVMTAIHQQLGTGGAGGASAPERAHSSTDSGAEPATTVPLPADSGSGTSTISKTKQLFQYLVQHLNVSPAQAALLKDSRLVAEEMDACLHSALSVCTQLRSRLCQTSDDLDAEFHRVRSVLTPTQTAKFLLWVARNVACVHFLNELWDKVYPLRSSSSAAASSVTTSKVSDPSQGASAVVSSSGRHDTQSQPGSSEPSTKTEK